MNRGEQERIVLFNLFIGMNGSGKSHNMLKWLRLNDRNLILPASRADKQWKGVPELKPKVIFPVDKMDPSGTRRRAQFIIPGINDFTGNRVVHIEGSDEERAAIFHAVIHPLHGFHNGGVFMDDSKRYIRTKGNLPGDVRDFFGDRRLHMNDIFLAAWQYQDVNADFFGFGGIQTFLFNVERAPNRNVLEKFPNEAEFMRVHQWVAAVNAQLHKDTRWYYLPFPLLESVQVGTNARAAAVQFVKQNKQHGARLAQP
jgi:hypothetical protein